MGGGCPRSSFFIFLYTPPSPLSSSFPFTNSRRLHPRQFVGPPQTSIHHFIRTPDYRVDRQVFKSLSKHPIRGLNLLYRQASVIKPRSPILAAIMPTYYFNKTRLTADQVVRGSFRSGEEFKKINLAARPI